MNQTVSLTLTIKPRHDEQVKSAKPVMQVVFVTGRDLDKWKRSNCERNIFN